MKLMRMEETLLNSRTKLPVGVYYNHGKYTARIVRRPKTINVGCFKTAEEASHARLLKLQEMNN